jgi:hypothetical protein
LVSTLNRNNYLKLTGQFSTKLVKMLLISTYSGQKVFNFDLKINEFFKMDSKSFFALSTLSILDEENHFFYRLTLQLFAQTILQLTLDELISWKNAIQHSGKIISTHERIRNPKGKVSRTLKN